jgi:hypothetical protein
MPRRPGFLWAASGVSGATRLVYPDNVTAVVSPVDPVGYLGGPMVFVGFGVPLLHLIGWLGGARNRRGHNDHALEGVRGRLTGISGCGGPFPW